MNIEPLNEILKLYKNKMQVFQDYLSKDVFKYIKDYNYYDKETIELYLDENIILVKKNTGKIEKKGKIISIKDETITIKYNNYCFTANIEDYYVFIKKRYNKNNRRFYQELLNQL